MSNKLIEYVLIVQQTLTELNETVTSYLREGWLPHGSPVIEKSGYYFQAAIKETE